MLATVTVAALATGVPSASADTFTSPATGTHTVVGAILADYQSLGGPGGTLGYPTTDELPTRDGVGRYNNFERGSIYWSPSTGAGQVGGAIRSVWAGLAFENGPLGYPTTNELPTRNGVGRYNHFQRGSIYWQPSTGAHEVRGAIRGEWAATGWENGPLGFPTTGELPTARSGGAYTTFQSGSIYWSPVSGAHAVRGAIRDRWAASGWENGPLGFPKTGEFAIRGGVQQDFQFGRIIWQPTNGTIVQAGQPFANCTEAWNNNAAPIYRGQYGYAPNLDRDGNGIACELDPR